MSAVRSDSAAARRAAVREAINDAFENNTRVEVYGGRIDQQAKTRMGLGYITAVDNDRIGFFSVLTRHRMQIPISAIHTVEAQPPRFVPEVA